MVHYVRLARSAWILSTLPAVARAVPEALLPFNSQVPTVARVNHPYLFQISASTFGPPGENFTYSLSNQPPWLSIDSATRTMTGAPSSSDEGTSVFTLTAADNNGTTQMQCTLVVSSEPVPRLGDDLSAQIAKSANLSVTQPPTVTVLPNTSFRFDFSHTSFIDVIPRTLYYYATLSDHTPLPSWLQFDSDQMTFSGIAPDLTAFPQAWDVNLILSDVPGFGGSSESFTIAVSTEQLVFVPQQQILRVGAGTPVDFTALPHHLFRNGQNLNATFLMNATSDVPPWLSFDPSTLIIKGIAPSHFENENVTITVTDGLGDTATAIVSIMNMNQSLFAGTIGTVAVRPGQRLDYHLADSLFTVPNPDLTLNVPEPASWISLDAQMRNLEGTAPTQAPASSIEATLVARASGLPPQELVFTVDLELRLTRAPESSATLTARASATNNPSSPSSLGSNQASRSRGVRGGVLAAVIILSLLALALSVVCVILYRQRRRAFLEQNESSASEAGAIFRDEHDTVDVNVARPNIEKGSGDSLTALPHRVPEPPPRIDLDLPLEQQRRTSRWRNRFSRISRVSSLGYGGEDAIKTDANIPEPGRESQLLLQSHHSFAVPSEISRLPRTASETTSAWLSLPEVSEDGRSQPHRNTRVGTRSRNRYSSTRDMRRRQRRHSFGLPGIIASSSLASLSTRGTSVLSARPSDFPRPPSTVSTSSSASLYGMTELTSAEKRKSIRLVDASELLSDDRPIDEKRQSFIRARASSGQANPLFAHGSRAGSRSTRQTASYAGSARRGTWVKSRGVTASIAESSSPSIEPQPRYMRHISCRTPTVFPHVISEFTLDADDRAGAEREPEREHSPDSSTTTSSFVNDQDLIRQLALPKHQRSWVLPGEASPTPPPLSIKSRARRSQRTEDMSGGLGNATG